MKPLLPEPVGRPLAGGAVDSAVGHVDAPQPGGHRGSGIRCTMRTKVSALFEMPSAWAVRAVGSALMASAKVSGRLLEGVPSAGHGGTRGGEGTPLKWCAEKGDQPRSSVVP